MIARGRLSGGVPWPGRAPAPIRWRRSHPAFAASDDLAAGAGFERSKISQALIDIFAVAFAIAFLTVTAVSIAAATFILFFVSLQ